MKLNKERTEEYYIPIADCPKCGLKDTPLSQQTNKFKHRDTKKEMELTFISCPACGWLANMCDENMQYIKGYVSIKDLEENGYQKKK